MIGKIKHVIRVITFQLKPACLLVAATVIKDAIGPRRVPLQAILRIVKGLSLECGSKSYVTLEEEAGDVT